jgi:hypothetical protein
MEESLKKTLRIYGMAHNLMLVPSIPLPPDTEAWACNDYKHYNKTFPYVRQQFTRWFNLHSERHMRATYPKTLQWYAAQAPKPIMLQKVLPDIPNSVEFPKDEVLANVGHRYIQFSGAWLMAYAEFLGEFTHVELYGFMISERKAAYAWERPNFFYWMDRLQRHGIHVTTQKEVWEGDCTPGSPEGYTGPLYGYETT